MTALAGRAKVLKLQLGFKFIQWLAICTIAFAFIGAALFSKGFLKVRKLNDEKSTCKQSSSSSPIIETKENQYQGFFGRQNDSSCWLPVQKSKLIIIVIDAIRIDFAVPSLSKNIAGDVAWYDKLTILNELASANKGHLYHFVADAPTATAQRLSALAAGTLPAFMEIASSFSESSLGSDNFIHQLLANDREIDLLGDDTWLSLFPEIKDKSKGLVAGFHSFHLFDLNTVDNGIKKVLFPRLKSQEYDVMIAHFLGLDHCGHKFGAAHVQCGEKLAEMDQVLRKVIDSMEAGTRLFVMGDHGMTDNGDHGGVSEKEISTVLFSYTKGDNIGFEKDADYWKKFIERMRVARIQGNGFADDYFFKKTLNLSAVGGSIPQLDFTPTISLLGGVPIPFGNIGSIIAELFIDHSKYQTMPRNEARLFNLKLIFDAFRVNASQVFRFLLTNQELGQSGFDKASLVQLTKLYSELSIPQLGKASPAQTAELYAKLSTPQQFDSAMDELEEAIFMHYEFLLATQRHCRRVWADFDMGSIITGLVIGLVAVIGLFVLVLAGCDDFSDIFALSLAVFHSVALTATSFITFEDWSVRFFLTSLLVQEIINSWYKHTLTRSKLFRIMAVCILIRITSLTGACREEQYPYCQVTVHRSIPFDDLWKFGIFALLGAIGLFLRGWDCLNVLQEKYQSTTRKFIAGRILYTLKVSLLGSFWLFTWIADTWSGYDAFALRNEVFNAIFSTSIPRLIFILSVISAIVYRDDKKLMLMSIATIIGVTLRPFAGWTTLVPGLYILQSCSFIFSGLIKPAIYSYLVGLHLFFTSAHQMTLTSLQWEAAFIGIRSTIHLISATLMIVNTLSGPILAALATNDGYSSLMTTLWYSTFQMMLTALFSTLLMRHLMVWKMFTPRFLLQLAISLIMLVTGLVRKSLS